MNIPFSFLTSLGTGEGPVDIFFKEIAFPFWGENEILLYESSEDGELLRWDYPMDSYKLLREVALAGPGAIAIKEEHAEPIEAQVFILDPLKDQGSRISWKYLQRP